MKKCWNPNSDNRPNAIEIKALIGSFLDLTDSNNDYDMEIVKQFEEPFEYKRANLSPIENNQTITHSQAIYTSQLLNPYTKE